jgi:hypothetical protein
LNTLSVLKRRTFSAVELLALFLERGLNNGLLKIIVGDLIFCVSAFGLDRMKVLRNMLGLNLDFFSSGDIWYSESTSVTGSRGGSRSSCCCLRIVLYF